MTILSSQQRSVVELPLGPVCVTACAGSGKTTTATHRLRQMRKLLDDRHGIVALLSFSNVAVDTFRRDYYALEHAQSASLRPSAVEIDTVDGFLTTNVIRPHSHRAMGAPRTAFLVDGRETFLKGFTVWDGRRGHLTADLRISYESGAFAYEAGPSYAAVKIAASDGQRALEKLGKIGAYTHSSGRYWAIRTLKEQPFVLRSLARRYPLILVDEAQDIGKEHQEILEMLAKAGSELSLIGDPNQGIYEFSGATGEFLRAYKAQSGVTDKGLTVNYRSVEAIVRVANKLSGRNDEADRKAATASQGALFLPYKITEKERLLDAFRNMLASANIHPSKAAVLCRSGKGVDEWRGGEEDQGQGTIKQFVNATIYRDKLHQYHDAFRYVCSAVVGLLADQHGQLVSRISRNQETEVKLLRRVLWAFVRDADAGVPAGGLLADSQWHPLLVARVKQLLGRLEKEFNLTPTDNIGNKLKKSGLLNKPLIATPDLASTPTSTPFRVSTIHQVKGESIDAVMYIADKRQVRALLDGTGTELGRIGYVAVTRARNLMVLAVPDTCVGEFETELVTCGFRKAGS
ncbi:MULTISPECIES: UvrD-helicase domain-containing protein [Bradyrhizobium]|uniref:UvrD-helicase domain-containing protein n=1 Tax=Bradyrhizobium TaxID=374 RepID=UPI001CD49DD3|nr:MULTISPECIES: ATP-dependent helicase [Bradyrhizobium]MCA1510152.1 ATP-dependent helicase [Bradyrhizobium sp. NBAIM01]MCA1526845.1 ATP-dependent helicase [Bradyrhizobium yuanmingense]